MKKIFTLLAFVFLLFGNVTFAQEPTISGVYPSSALPGSTVTITGTNFSGTTSVTVHGQESQFSVVNANTISFKVPLKYSGPDKVRIVSPSGIAERSFYVNMPPESTITGFSPSSITRGGTVTITGTNLSYIYSIGIGGMEWEEGFVVNSNTSVSFKVPNNAFSGPGVLLSVKSSTSFAQSQNELTIPYEPAPSITSIAPLSGKAGSSVTITGTNFLTTQVVYFGNVPTYDFIVNSATSITALVPWELQAEKIAVQTSSGKVYSSANFTSQAGSSPTISSFTPTSGTPGTLCTITGNLGTNYGVLLNGNIITDYISVSPTSTTFKIPPGVTSGLLEVINSAGSAKSTSNFNVLLPPAPTITSISSTSAQAGSTITISGTNFTGLYSVEHNGFPCEIIDFSPTSIVVKVFNETTGAIKVSAWGGVIESGTNLTVTAPSVATITSFSPTSGYYNQPVTITGTNFNSVSSINFGNEMVFDFVVNSPTSITARVPSGDATGKISFTTFGGKTESAAIFTKTYENAPTITSFSPTSGPVGTNVTITGTNLLSSMAVKIGEVFTEDIKINSSTSVSVKIPEGSTSGKIMLGSEKALYEFQDVTSTGDFIVTPQSAPTITSFNPTSAYVGSSITINGTNFLSTYYLIFKDIIVTDFTVNSSTSITAIIPVGAATGSISVVTAGGTAVSSANLTIGVPPSPTITSFNPTNGAVGSTVTITGTNFTGATAVKFNNVSATSFSVVSSTSITAVVPSGVTTGKVSVTTPGGTVVSTSDFTVTVLPPPVISSFSPVSAIAGTLVTITGSNFLGTTSVKFNNIEASSFTVLSSTALTAVVPAEAATGKIKVITAGGAVESNSTLSILGDIVKSGTYLLRDIIQGTQSSSSYASNYMKAGDLVFFTASATDGSKNGLYRTDGTSEGTQFLKVLPNRLPYDPYLTKNAVDFNGKIAFTTAGSGSDWHDLWISDGTADGTYKLPVPAATGVNNINDLTVYNNSLYFVIEGGNTGRGVYKWNGTTLTKLIPANDENYNNDLKLFAGDGKLYHSNYTKIYDISTDSPVEIFDLKKVSTRTIQQPVYFNGKIVFNETVFQEHDHGIRILDPITKQYSSIIEGIDSGFDAASERNDYKVQVGNSLYYYRTYIEYAGSAPVGEYVELMKISPAFQVSSVKKIAATPHYPNNVVLLGNSDKVVMAFGNGNNYLTQLWVSDGTTNGTTPIIDLSDNIKVSIDQRQFFINNSKLLFLAKDYNSSGVSVYGNELWISDFTKAGTKMAVDIGEADYSGIPDSTNFAPIGKGSIITTGLYRKNKVSPYGFEPWISDGSPIQYLGISEETTNESIKLYPNPVKDQLFITAKDNVEFNDEEVKVIDMSGKVLFKNYIIGSEGMVPMDQLSTGIYIINIAGSNFKIIKK